MNYPNRLELYNWLKEHKAEDGMLLVIYDKKLKLAVLTILSKQYKYLMSKHGVYMIFDYHHRAKEDLMPLQLYDSTFGPDDLTNSIRMKAVLVAEYTVMQEAQL